MVNNLPANARRCRFDPGVGKIPWRRGWHLTPVFLPGESHGQRILADYSSQSHKESDTKKQQSTQHRFIIFTEPQKIMREVSINVT